MPQAAAQAAAGSARAAADPGLNPGLRQQKGQPADDLFDGVTEDDRFDIPAFLRRQNTGT